MGYRASETGAGNEAASMKWEKWRAVRRLAPPSRSLAVVLHALGTLFSTGVSANLVFSLTAGCIEADDTEFAEDLREIQLKVIQGTRIGTAISGYSHRFTSPYISAIRSGEQAGSLSEVLTMLSELERQWYRTRYEIYQALVYPVFVSLVLALLVFVLLPMLVHNLLSATQTGGPLPWPTALLWHVCQWMQSWVFWLVVLLVLWQILHIADYARLRQRVLRVLQQLPIVGTAVRAAAYHGFFTTFYVSTKSGVALKQALTGAADVVGNQVLTGAILDRTESLVQGQGSLAEVFEDFEPIARELMKTAEETGNVETMAKALSNHYAGLLSERIQTALSLLEPILMAVMGLVVGFVLIATFLPLTKLAEAL